jgi:tetratricopeptide (TPR) repeat protein
MKSLISCIGLFFFLTLPASGAIDSTGIKLIAEREFEKAQAYFEAAIKANPGDLELHYYLAVALQRQHKISEAQDEIEDVLEKNDNVSKYHYLRGAILGEKARDANPISQGFLAPKIKNAFLRAAELDPKSVDAHIGLFNYYFQAPGIMGGSNEKAMAEAKIVQDLDPYRGHMCFASYYAKKDSVALAEREYKKAIAANPKIVYTYYQLGMYLENQNKTDQANAQFKKMIEIDPKDANGYYMYGRAMYNLERWDEAIAKYQYALYLEKNDPASIWMLANAYEKKGLSTKAKETYQWLLQIEPNGKRADQARKKIKELH